MKLLALLCPHPRVRLCIRSSIRSRICSCMPLPVLFFLFLLLFLAPAALAHVPVMADGNENIPSAMPVADPTKSWAIYGSLPPNSAQYYYLDLEKGQRIYLSLLRSTNPEEGDFLPGLALLGPGLDAGGQLPIQVTLPGSLEGYGFLSVPGRSAPSATYEPFGPSSFIKTAELDIPAPESGRYYAAIYDNQTGGHYTLAVGDREVWSFTERITAPIRLISVYLWQGQSLAMILIPYLAAEMIGLLVFWRSTRRTAYSMAGTLAGFLFLATSASVINQIIFNLTRAPFGPEVYISAAIAIFHAILGVAAIRLARGEAGILQRALMAVIGTVALLSGSGLLMGPVLAVAGSVLPSRKGQAPGPLPSCPQR